MQSVKEGGTRLFWAGWVSLSFLACGKVTEAPLDIHNGELPTSGGSTSAGGSNSASSGGAPSESTPPVELDRCTFERNIATCPDSGRQVASHEEGFHELRVEAIAAELPDRELRANGGQGGADGEEGSFVFSFSGRQSNCPNWNRDIEGEYLLYQSPHSEYEIFSAGSLCERGESLARGVSDSKGVATVQIGDESEAITVKMTVGDMPCAVFTNVWSFNYWADEPLDASHQEFCTFFQEGGQLVIK